MQITTKSEYAIRALAEMALNSSARPMSISHICRNQNLPEKYMEQIFRKLKRNNLVESIHGSQGGYILKQNTAEISLADIVNAVEDKKLISDCSTIDYCSGKPCGLLDFWNEIQAHIDSYFESLKLEKIISLI